LSPYARHRKDPWHPNADWIQDDLVDTDAAWRLIQRLPESSLEQVVSEKQAAVRQIAEDRAALQHLVRDDNRGLIEPLVHTLVYAESLFASLADLLAGLVAYRRFLRSRDAGDADACRRRLFSAQTHWNHHTQRHASLPGAATA